MKNILSTIIILVITTCNLSAQQLNSDQLNQIPRWRGKFTFTVDNQDIFPQASLRVERHWSFSGEIVLEKVEDYNHEWAGEQLDFSGTVNDKEIWDSLKYYTDITCRKQKENYNSAYLSVDPDRGTYRISISPGDFEQRYFVTIPPELEALKNDTLLFILYAMAESNKIEKEATIDDFSFVVSLEDMPFDFNNPKITYSGLAETNHSLFSAEPLEGFLVLNLSPATDEPDIKVTVNKTTNPHCLCNDSIVEFSANTTSGGGVFEKFEIEYLSDKHPETVINQGGAKPSLVLKATGETAGKVKVKAVYKKDGILFKSKAYDMNFCKVEKPQSGHTVSNSHGYDVNKFVFSEDDPATIKIRLFTHIFYNGEKVEDSESAFWSMDPNEDYLIKTNTEYGVGVEYKAENMPRENEKFGKKNIKLEYFGDQCDCTSPETEIQIFYPRDAKNNASEDDWPNWTYYWMQTKAAVKGVNIKVWTTIPPQSKAITGLALVNCLDPAPEMYTDPNLFARYDAFADRIDLSENLPDKLSMNRPNPDGTMSGVCDKGIDAFAVNMRHENNHRKELVSWWGLKMVNYTCTEDYDGDLVPNTVENNTPGCDYMDRKSSDSRPYWLWDNVTDIEMNSYNVGWQWKMGDADKEDWGSPGKQF